MVDPTQFSSFLQISEKFKSNSSHDQVKYHQPGNQWFFSSHRTFTTSDSNSPSCFSRSILSSFSIREGLSPRKVSPYLSENKLYSQKKFKDQCRQQLQKVLSRDTKQKLEDPYNLISETLFSSHKLQLSPRRQNNIPKKFNSVHNTYNDSDTEECNKTNKSIIVNTSIIENKNIYDIKSKTQQSQLNGTSSLKSSIFNSSVQNLRSQSTYENVNQSSVTHTPRYQKDKNPQQLKLKLFKKKDESLPQQLKFKLIKKIDDDYCKIEQGSSKFIQLEKRNANFKRNNFMQNIQQRVEQKSEQKEQEYFNQNQGNIIKIKKSKLKKIEHNNSIISEIIRKIKQQMNSPTITNTAQQNHHSYFERRPRMHDNMAWSSVENFQQD